MRVSMGTLVENAKAIRARISPSVKMLCVVKADAYGHDALALSRALYDIADAYAVAIVEEARELRQGGIDKMIVVLGGACEESLRESVQIGASQAVYTPEALRVLEDEAVRSGRNARAHLKIDSGMARIGVRSEEALEELLKVWKECPHVEMEGCFTHFCVAETDPEYTSGQNACFDAMLCKVREAGFNPVAHAAASTAMLNPEWQHDMVRAGIALYGSCMPEMAGELRHAQTLATKPIRIECIHAGDTVGYGRTFRASRDTMVMTLPVGYGDGYPRLLSNRAEVLVHGKRAKIIGNVCMDMLMADVTDIPDVSLDDEVVLMGSQGNECITPDELAELADTIPYEIMLGFSRRVPRMIVD